MFPTSFFCAEAAVCTLGPMGPHPSCTADAVQATAAFSLFCLPLFHSVNDWHRCNPLAALGVLVIPMKETRQKFRTIMFAPIVFFF